MSPPLVSVCVPVFNVGRRLDRCLRAITAQRRDDMELLIVDNDSTDDTREIASEATRGLPWARLIRNEKNLGRIENWNRCLDLATGRFVKFVMGHDVLWRGSLDLLLKEAVADPALVIVASQHRFWDGGEGEPPNVAPPAGRRRYSALGALRAVSLGANPFWALNGLLFRRDVVEREHLRLETRIPYLSDVHFCCQLARHGETLFLETSTYWFNMGVPTRYHFQGMRVVDFYSEVRSVQTDVASYLEGLGAGRSNPERGVYRHFVRQLQAGTPIDDVVAVRKIFEARRSWRARALIAWFWYRSGARRALLGCRESLRVRLPLLARLWRVGRGALARFGGRRSASS